jgi:hypothetical protein
MVWTWLTVIPPGVGAHDDPGQDIADDQRLTELLGNDAAQQPCNQDDGDIGGNSHGSGNRTE